MVQPAFEQRTSLLSGSIKKKKKKKDGRRDSISRTKIQQKPPESWSIFFCFLNFIWVFFFLTRTSHTSNARTPLPSAPNCGGGENRKRLTRSAGNVCVVFACLWYVVAPLLNLYMCVPLGAIDTYKFNIYKL